jgi:hypothetical protein
MINWSNIKNFNRPDNEDLVNFIHEQKLEQKRIMEIFNIFNEKMKVFATERSFESCLDILNITIQLSNIRANLIRSFEQYTKNLEDEMIKINRNLDKKP